MTDEKAKEIAKEIATDKDLEAAVAAPESSKDDTFATVCRGCKHLVVAPDKCKCEIGTHINQAGQVFEYVHGSTSYNQNQPSAVVRTVAQWRRVKSRAGKNSDDEVFVE